MIDPLSGLRIVETRVSDGTYPESPELLDVAALRAQSEDRLSRWLYAAGQASALRQMLESPHVFTHLSLAERQAFRRITRPYEEAGDMEAEP